MTATWDEWVSLAVTACGVPEKEYPMVSLWASILAEGGADPGAAAAALKWVLLNDPQDWRPNLIHALGRRLKAQAAAPAQAGGPCPDSEACAICGGKDGEGFAREAVGRVVVPDPDRLDDRKEVAVYCRCPLGRWFQSSAPTVKVRGKECRVWNIDQINERFESIDPAPGCGPGWRGWAKWWRDLRARELGLLERAREGDRDHGRLTPQGRVRQLAERWRAG